MWRGGGGGGGDGGDRRARGTRGTGFSYAAHYLLFFAQPTLAAEPEVRARYMHKCVCVYVCVDIA